ncbi:hypothetical protein FRACYDRAFT_238490 [Fragilariopsis cylindrus CCMP1102]|uniref:Uncharacterized protein n=1 Tax=Fragilariopsis cylindrus CCMP1102 TaxID=635003 RepID=A0A1E7FIU2_9STRA|nr:hypothetical protein FRACYDRAFT_238490 [Fragilariopsis cylindrus CCMP1102]|eukprot:OEU18057.1 hypothetical protein FRACYDRAFT_238490 [Fragilariopsis cylindrus CCMP1102]
MNEEQSKIGAQEREKVNNKNNNDDDDDECVRNKAATTINVALTAEEVAASAAAVTAIRATDDAADSNFVTVAAIVAAAVKEEEKNKEVDERGVQQEVEAAVHGCGAAAQRLPSSISSSIIPSSTIEIEPSTASTTPANNVVTVCGPISTTSNGGWSKVEFKECPDCGELYHIKGMGQHRIFCSRATDVERGRTRDKLIRKRKNDASRKEQQFGVNKFWTAMRNLGDEGVDDNSNDNDTNSTNENSLNELPKSLSSKAFTELAAATVVSSLSSRALTEATEKATTSTATARSCYEKNNREIIMHPVAVSNTTYSNKRRQLEHQQEQRQQHRYKQQHDNCGEEQQQNRYKDSIRSLQVLQQQKYAHQQQQQQQQQQLLPSEEENDNSNVSENDNGNINKDNGNSKRQKKTAHVSPHRPPQQLEVEPAMARKDLVDAIDEFVTTAATISNRKRSNEVDDNIAVNTVLPTVRKVRQGLLEIAVEQVQNLGILNKELETAFQQVLMLGYLGKQLNKTIEQARQAIVTTTNLVATKLSQQNQQDQEQRFDDLNNNNNSNNSEQEQVVIDMSCLSDSEKEKADGVINENNTSNTGIDRVIPPRDINEGYNNSDDDDKSNYSTRDSDDDLVF